MHKQQLIQAFADHIKSIYRDPRLNDQELMQAICENVFAVTMKFDSVAFVEGESRSDSQAYLNRYGDWFHRIMMQSFGNHLGRKRQFQPVSFAFVDFPGSRDRKRISYNELRRLGQLHKLHVHAIVALQPNGQQCRRPLLVAGSAHQLRKYGNVMVEAFNPAKGTLENMVEYCAKGALAVDGGHTFADMWELFPYFRDKTKRPTSNAPSSKSQLPSASGF